MSALKKWGIVLAPLPSQLSEVKGKEDPGMVVSCRSSHLPNPQAHRLPPASELLSSTASAGCPMLTGFGHIPVGTHRHVISRASLTPVAA